jgi:CobQ-like glutamine amidotransferase family enzyme
VLRAARGLRGHELVVDASTSARRSIRPRTTSSTSAAARTASRRSIAPDLAAKASALQPRTRAASRCSPCAVGTSSSARATAAATARHAGAGLFPHETVAGDVRMIGDVLLECELDPGSRRQLAGFENHAGRTLLDSGAEPLGRVVYGFGNDGSSGFEGCRLGNAIGTYLHGPLLPRNPWLADWLLARALAHAGMGAPPALEPLPDELETSAFGVAADRARRRGGRR